MAVPRVHDLSRGGVGGGEGGMVGGELDDETVEDVFEVGEGAFDLGGNGLGDGDTVGDGGARGAGYG